MQEAVSNGDREMGSRDKVAHNPSDGHCAGAAHVVATVCNEASAMLRLISNGVKWWCTVGWQILSLKWRDVKIVLYLSGPINPGLHTPDLILLLLSCRLCCWSRNPHAIESGGSNHV